MTTSVLERRNIGDLGRAADSATDRGLRRTQEMLAPQQSKPFGTQLTSSNDSYAELRLTLEPWFQQEPGLVPAGLVAYLADNAIARLGGKALGRQGAPSEFKLNHLRPAVGDELVARAYVIYRGQNQAVCRCDVFAVNDGDEAMCAAAQGTIAKFSQVTAA